MRVSIITSVLNGGTTIEDAIKSILSQTYTDIEYIVVDGGSTDSTPGILRRYRENITKYISEPDKGIYDAMNKGIKLATGDIIGFLNADDFYAGKHVIHRIVEAFQANHTDCCYGDLEYVAANNLNKVIRKWKSQPYERGLFEKGWHPPHPTFFAKKTVFDRYGGFNSRYTIGGDYELMLRFLVKCGIKSCYIPEILVKMRTGGISNKYPWYIIKANIECYRAWKDNDLKISPLGILKKPLIKLIQYIRS